MSFRRLLLILMFAQLSACSSESEKPDARDTTPPYIDSSSSPIDPIDTAQFLTANAARENVTVTESGLQYEVLRAANGPRPTAQSTVTVHYTGTLIDRTEFDSSYARGTPATFALSGTIQGWVEGVPLMNVGSQFRLVLPSELAYGNQGAGTLIRPGDALVFEIELLEINAN